MRGWQSRQTVEAVPLFECPDREGYRTAGGKVTLQPWDPVQEQLMNETIRSAAATDGPSATRPLALFSAPLLIGIAVYASRAVAPVPAAASAGAEQIQQPTAPTPHAVAAATAFLDALDAGQREKVLYEFDSAKKANWSNLPVTIVPRNG